MPKTIFIVIAAFLILGYFFVRWANKPENVEALLKQREADRRQAVADSLKTIAGTKKVERETAAAHAKNIEAMAKTDDDLQLVVDENFLNNQFHQLTKGETISAKLKDNTLIYSTTVYKKSSRNDVCALTKDEYQNFVAEMDIIIAGDEIGMGIVFNYNENHKKTMLGRMTGWNGDYVYSGLPRITTTVGAATETERLVSLQEAMTFKSIPNQKLRIEKKGNRLRVSVNGQMKVNRSIAKFTHNKGRIGILATTTNSGDWNESVIGTVKNFKLWTW